MAMENCDVRYGEITHSISTVNVQVSHPSSVPTTAGNNRLEGLGNWHGLVAELNENGTFPNLDTYAVFERQTLLMEIPLVTSGYACFRYFTTTL